MHQQIIDQLSAYHDGELPSAQQTQVETHLRTCATCRERLAQLQALSALLTAYTVEIEATEEFWERLEPRLPTRARTAPARVRQRSKHPWLFLPPLGLLLSKTAVQAVMFVSLAFYGVYSLGLLPAWVNRGLEATTLLPDSLTRSIALTLLTHVLPSPLPSLMDYTVSRAPSALSALAGFVAPALIYAIVAGIIALLYLAWTALWWRGLRSTPASNGN
ncbi:MAG: zf-HC2 domain-containing protein [Anaerolineae bacterium]|nr:zf-HC2 domain-containing protein [Anaerolineae bacterium]